MKLLSAWCNRVRLKFTYAIEGFILGVKSDPSIQIQMGFALFAIIVAGFLGFEKNEWFILLILIALVIGLEFANSAIEKICDLIQPEKDPRIKKIKDLSAAAVLVMSVVALTVGIAMVLFHIM